METSALELFLKKNKITSPVIIAISSAFSILFAALIIVTPEIPTNFVIVIGAVVLFFTPFYGRSTFYLQVIIFNLVTTWIGLYEPDTLIIATRNLLTFNIFLIIVGESLLQLSSANQSIRKKLHQRNQLLEAIIHFVLSTNETHKILPNVPTILHKLGESLEVSRIYLFKNGKDKKGLFMTQTNEWVSKGISKQIENQTLLKLYYEYSGYERWRDILSENKIINGPIETFPLEERKLLKDQDIISILVIPIFSGETFWGFMGIDDCLTRRIWDEEIILIVRTFASILGSTLYLESVNTNLEKQKRELEDINLLMLKRELRIKELKERINILERKK